MQYRSLSGGMAVNVGFRILGPISVWHQGGEIELGAPRQCGVLALLLLSRGQPLTVSAVVDEIWGPTAPRTADAAVRTYVSQLRHVVQAADGVIDSSRAGYALSLPPGTLDLLTFEQRVSDARMSRENAKLEVAAGLFREALELWRGRPLAGVNGHFVARERSRLEQLRLLVGEERFALDLELGRHGEVLSELSGLVLAAPLQERLRELQMLALYRCSRQAEALAAYQEIDRRLREELGIEPGPALRELHERILRGDAALDLPARLSSGVRSCGVEPVPVATNGTTASAGRAPAEAIDCGLSADRSATVSLGGRKDERGGLAVRLRAGRDSGFVGRSAERALFTSALTGDSDSFAVLVLHGLGGIGKSTLARRLADDAEAANRPVMWVDGREVGSSMAAFLDVVGAAEETPGVVLVIDTFERCDTLEPWLRTEFLPRLPEDALVVIAGRNRPSPSWRTDSSWLGALHIQSVNDLSPAEASALLRTRGVPEALHDSVIAYAGGHPLALALAAEMTKEMTASASAPGPALDVIQTLLAELVGSTPSPIHQRALQVCANVSGTTEELLRAVLPGEDTKTLFDWLRSQPYVECGRDGIRPHDVVRDALELDLRWRDPAGYEKIRLHVRDYMLNYKVSRRMTPLEASWGVGTLRSLGFDVPGWLAEKAVNPPADMAARPADYQEMLALAAEVSGPQAVQNIEFWLARQPGAFRVYRYRENSQIVGISSWLRLSQPNPEELSMDPVVAAAWKYVASIGPLRPDQHIAVCGSLVREHSSSLPQAGGQLRAAADPVRSEKHVVSELAEWDADPHLAWTFTAIVNPERMQSVMDSLGKTVILSAPTIDGQPVGIFARDWRGDYSSVARVLRWQAPLSESGPYCAVTPKWLAGFDKPSESVTEEIGQRSHRSAG